MVCSMETLTESPANVTKLTRVDQTLRALCDEVLRRGFYGVAAIELAIHDGTIQRICRKVEQVER